MSSAHCRKSDSVIWERPAVRAGGGNINDGQAASGRLGVTAGSGYFTMVKERERRCRGPRRSSMGRARRARSELDRPRRYLQVRGGYGFRIPRRALDATSRWASAWTPKRRRSSTGSRVTRRRASRRMGRNEEAGDLGHDVPAGRAELREDSAGEGRSGFGVLRRQSVLRASAQLRRRGEGVRRDLRVLACGRATPSPRRPWPCWSQA